MKNLFFATMLSGFLSMCGAPAPANEAGTVLVGVQEMHLARIEDQYVMAVVVYLEFEGERVSSLSMGRRSDNLETLISPISKIALLERLAFRVMEEVTRLELGEVEFTLALEEGFRYIRERVNGKDLLPGVVYSYYDAEVLRDKTI